MILMLLISITICVLIYSVIYYIVTFNVCFDGIDRNTLKQSNLVNKIFKYIKIVVVFLGVYIIFKTQDLGIDQSVTLQDDDSTRIYGAGLTSVTIKLWGYIIFAILMVVAVFKAIKFFKEKKTRKVVISLVTIPGYLLALFLVMTIFQFAFVKPNELDREKQYIEANIRNTRTAYNINVQENELDSSEYNNLDVVNDNSETVNNTAIVSQDITLDTLNDNQTSSNYYSYSNSQIGKYNINGNDELVYLSPRQIESKNNTSYNNKTYEYTHGIGQIVVSATSVTEDGNIKYLQKDVSGSDNIYEIKEPRMYYGVETNSVAVTNTKNKTEYDYTDNNGVEHTYNYTGDSGIQVGFFDRLILAIRNRDIKLAMSGSVSSESKILTNRNIIERARTILPNLIYDENPYTVIDNGQIYWVLDAYTVSDQYPYSTYTEIEYDGARRNINYIRNSVKVIVNAYDGDITFYITDRNDPIIMAYLKLYPTIFSDYNGKEIPEGIKSQFKYPRFLYNVQSEMLMVYHNVKEDVLYRNSDIWALTKYGTASTKTKTATLKPYYAMIKTPDNENAEFGLVQMYTQNEKSNIISYLVGTCDGTECKLKVYKYPTDSNILGPIQLDSQISQDETISAELESINVTGSKISKDMKIIPIDNSILYVETIYQTMTNEPNQTTTLKKVIVASGTKVAIGDTLSEAITNLLSQSAVNIELTNTEDIEGLIEAIINANNNLTESNNRNDWEMMGSDLKELQSLIDSLDKMKKENDKK